MIVTVVGTGTMGSGIAYASVVAGFDTVVNDISTEFLDRALRNITGFLDTGIERGKLEVEEKKAALGRLKLEQDLTTAVEGAGLVIEAVPEDIALKCKIFGRLDKSTAPDTVLATNSSSLSITEIAAATNEPSRVIGMHFFNPVPKMKLVEIVRGLETGEKAFKTVEDVAHKMGKETVDIRESPGFVTSRINALIGNEAFYMLEEGVASAEDIDKALKLGLNHPMGPFEMVDLVGLDVRLGVLTYLHERLGEKYRPAPLLVRYVKAGRLGRKVGRGVYEYGEAKTVTPGSRR
jgi:3-hydroxybutyryl-CoA dehydrogenase